MLLTKLFKPEPGENLVSRVDLFEKLDAGSKQKLILVSAPAGFGKTTLISEWINNSGIANIWFSVDGGDNDIVDFVSYILYGAQKIKNDFGKSILSLLKSPSHPGIESIITLIINELVLFGQEIAIVLDDFHHIQNEEILQAVNFLLEHCPVNVKLIIISRTEPQLSLAKLRSKNQLLEIRLQDLCFTAHEIAILFQKKMKLSLSVEDVQSLEKKTEGWIAGLQLAAISLQGQKNASAFVGSFAGNNRYIMDYLIEEVLRQQTKDREEFLLKTSFLGQFSASLCDFLLNRNDSQFILEELEQSNMFIIPLDTARIWYRYHHLFADLLQKRILQYHFNINELHQKASEWYEKNEMMELAIDHAMQMKDYHKSIRLLNKVVENMWEEGLHTLILKYGNSLPLELIMKNPQFSLYYSWILISQGQVQKAGPFLEKAKTIIEQQISQKQAPEYLQKFKKLKGKIAVAYAYYGSFIEYSDESLVHAQTAMDYLSDEDPFWYSWAWFSYAVSYYSKGDLKKSDEAFTKAFYYAKRKGNIFLLSTIAIRMAENKQQLGQYKLAYKQCANLIQTIKDRGYGQLIYSEWTFASIHFIMGITELMWARSDTAMEKLEIAYHLSKKGNDIYLRVFILMAYSTILDEQGDENAKQLKLELEELIAQNDVPPFLLSYFLSMKIYFCIRTQDLETAYQLLSEYGFDSNNEMTYANESVFSSYARLLIAEGKNEDAELLLMKLWDFVSNSHQLERMIDVKILFAMLNQAKGDKEMAQHMFLDAMKLAAPENLISFFVFNLNDIEGILSGLFDKSLLRGDNIPVEFLEKLKNAIAQKKELKKIKASLELSSREMDILRGMARDLANRDIADELFISIHTVKSHVKNILIKLDSENRKKAVEKAKNIGII